MPHADVVVVGAGLAGLVAAARIAEAGATVTLVAKGHASTHWGSGGIDVAGPAGAATPAEGVAHPRRRWTTRTASSPPDVAPSVAWLLERLEAGGLPYAGTSTRRSGACPTAIGGTRRVAIVPAAQAAALRPWEPDERPGRRRASRASRTSGPRPSPTASAARRVWMGADRPARVTGVTRGPRRRRGPQQPQRPRTLPAASTIPRCGPTTSPAFAAAIKKAAGGRPGRVAVPAIMGLEQHAEAWADLRARLPLEPFEIPLVPPSIPGIRLWRVLRRDHPRRRRARAGRRGRRADPRRGRPRHGRGDGGRRTVAGHPHGGPGARHRRHRGRRARGHARRSHRRAAARAARGRPPSTRSGWSPTRWTRPATRSRRPAFRTDGGLRPLAQDGRPASLANVRVAGALLAGQRSIRERCGDGIAVASGWRAANELTAGATRTPIEREPLAVRTDQ